MQRTINSARNPKYVDRQHTMIDIEVDFDELDEEYIWYTLTSHDEMPHGQTLRANTLAGLYGPITPWSMPDNITGADALDLLRYARNKKLAEADFIEQPTVWNALTAEKQAEWTSYKQALRNMPQTHSNPEWGWDDDGEISVPHNFSWPVKPS